MTEPVSGCTLLARSLSRDPRFAWVVLCERTDAGEGITEYVVWYENRSGHRSVGYYTSSLEDARLEFERRS